MAPSVMAGIPALKADHAQLRTRMDKAVLDLPDQPRLHPHRSCLHPHARPGQSRLLRHAHAAQPGRPDHHARRQLIVIQPWDVSLIGEIEKSLRTSDLGFNPNNDGKIVRVPVPPMTEERRREVVKHLHRVLEDHRTAVRNIRRDGNDLIKKA
jgi:ribosome recycling factor